LATKTLYVLTTAAISGNSWFPLLQDGGSAPAAATSAFGYAPGKLAVNSFCRSRLGATATSATTATTSFIDSTSGPQAGSSATLTGDSFRAGPYNGTFAATSWTFVNNLIATVAGLTGRLRLRVWKSANADGSSATALTASTQVATAAAVTTTAANQGITWSPGTTIALNNEYLFFQFEFQEQTSAGSSNTDNALWRQGSSITTPDFVPALSAVVAQTIGAPWTPANYSSGTLSDWHDPSNSANITQSAGAISADADLSGDGHTNTQAGTGKPTVSSAAINGLDAESFDGSTTYFESNFDTGAETVFSFIWVVKTGTIGATRALSGYSASNGPEWRINASGNMELLQQFVTGLATSTTALSANTVYILGLSFRKSSGAFRFRVNGADAGSNLTGIGATTFATGGLQNIGRIASGPSDFFNGLLGGRITIASDTLSDIQLAEGFLAPKWGVSLDAAHPYKSAPPIGGPFTQVATATLGGIAANAVVAQTFGTLGQTATATDPVAAAVAQALGTLGRTATAAVNIAASVAQTLGPLGQTATATAPSAVNAVVAQTLGTLGQAATAAVTDALAAAQTFAAMTRTARRRSQIRSRPRTRSASSTRRLLRQRGSRLLWLRPWARSAKQPPRRRSIRRPQTRTSAPFNSSRPRQRSMRPWYRKASGRSARPQRYSIRRRRRSTITASGRWGRRRPPRFGLRRPFLRPWGLLGEF
jgi:hypothetical protein